MNNSLFEPKLFIRTIPGKNKDSTSTTYVQLTPNFRDTKDGNSRADFGRANSLDVEAIRRLVRSL